MFTLQNSGKAKTESIKLPYVIKTKLGRNLVVKDGDMVEVVKFPELTTEFIHPEDAEGRTIKTYRPYIPVDEIKNVNGINLTFTLGYIFGCLSIIGYRLNKRKKTFIMGFSSDGTRDLFMRKAERYIDSHFIEKNSCGLSTHDAMWSKVCITSKSLISIHNKIGVGFRKNCKLNKLKNLPIKFKLGMVVGMFDCRGLIVLQKEQFKKYGQRKYRKFSAMFDLCNNKIYKMVLKIVESSGLDFQLSDYFNVWRVHKRIRLSVPNIRMHSRYFSMVGNPKIKATLVSMFRRANTNVSKANVLPIPTETARLINDTMVRAGIHKKERYRARKLNRLSRKNVDLILNNITQRELAIPLVKVWVDSIDSNYKYDKLLKPIIVSKKNISRTVLSGRI